MYGHELHTGLDRSKLCVESQERARFTSPLGGETMVYVSGENCVTPYVLDEG